MTQRMRHWDFLLDVDAQFSPSFGGNWAFFISGRVMFHRSIITIMLVTFFLTSLGPLPDAHAQTMINLPAPGLMVSRSAPFQPSQLKGIQVNPDNPMRFEFLVDKGNSALSGQAFKDEVTRLTKYFLTSLTVPESDLWVNLSPYEKDRIAPDHLGTTQMGKDLLEQDYLLKQVVATISYPEQKLGAAFWKKVHEKAYELYGTTEVPSSTFNKVWIVPQSADVYVRGNSAFVVNSKLDVMLEADYLALSKNGSSKGTSEYSKAYSDVFREVILPELRIEVNRGKNFALLRQMYDAMILAAWYKRHLHNSFLGKKYIGKNKVNGVNLEDKNVKERIFQQYLASFKKRVYSYIKEDYDPFMQKTIPRKYVSGGMAFDKFTTSSSSVYKEQSNPTGIRLSNDLAMATVDLSPVSRNLNRFPRLATTTAMALLAGAAFFGGSANAAVFSANANGTVDVTIEQNDTYGAILQQMGAAWQGVNKAEHQKSVLAGSLWGKQGSVQKVAGTQDVKLKTGQKINISIQYPAQALAVLKKDVGSSITVAAATAVPSPMPMTAQQMENHMAKMPSSFMAPTMAMPNQKAVAQLKETPIQPDNGTTLAVAAALGLGMVGARKYVTKKKPEVSDDKKKVVTKVNAPDLQVVPTPSTDRSEQAILKDAHDAMKVAVGQAGPETHLKVALKGIQEVAANYVHQSVQPAKEQALLSGWVKNFFIVMDYLNIGVGVALLGSMLGFDQWQTYALAPTLSFMGRAFLGSHIAVHEGSHAVAAAPWGIKESLSKSNLSANLSSSTWKKLFTPFTGIDKNFNPRVALPKKAQEGKANTFVKSAGFAVTTFVTLTVGALLAIAASSGNTISQLLLFPWTMASALVVAGSFWTDILNKSVISKALAYCGIIGMAQAVPASGVLLKTLEPWTNWLTKATDFLTDRGGQQVGASNLHQNSNGDVVSEIEKTLKSKRGLGFDGLMPVFYRNMISDLYRRFYGKLPKFLVPVDNFGRPTMFGVFSHVRFATGGELVKNAAHPHASAIEKKLIWAFDASAKLVSRMIDVIAVVGHNGDNDGAKIGIPSVTQMFHSKLDVSQMRRIFPALVHKYYDGKVTLGLLGQKVTTNAEDENQKVPLQHAPILKALKVHGYVLSNGRVNRSFKGLSDAFKAEFVGYSDTTFSKIESVLYDLPPGDSPIIPLQIHLYMTQGNWDASARYAHVMVNHKNTKELMEDVLLEDQERAVGQVFSDVFSKVEKFLSRPGYVPPAGSFKSLKDLWIKDQDEANERGISEQYAILQTFKGILIKAMKDSVADGTDAGKIFQSWEAKWKDQKLDIDQMRRLYVETMVEKFFTADREAAVQEFAKRADGTYGIFVRTSVLDDGFTVYSNNQDIAIGRNAKGVVSFASDPRVLKTVGHDGTKMDEVMHLKDGEIVDMAFIKNNVIQIKSHQKLLAGWREAANDEIDHRFYPTAKVVNGKPNPYYAPPPVEYKDVRKIVQTDLDSISRIIADAKEIWDNQGSFNRQTSRHLAERLKSVYEKTGKARLVIIGYDNSESLSKNLKIVLDNMIPNLTIDVIDANEFDANPKKFKITKDDVSLIVSKSGATFSTKLAANILKLTISQDNLFVMTARIDSVLNTVIGQGLRPEDPFTKRIFITGEFYPSEAPVASEMLLEYQLSQTAFHLAKDLRQVKWTNNIFDIPFDLEDLNRMHAQFEQYATDAAKQFTGVDKQGKKYHDLWGAKLRKTGTYKGNAFFETFVINRIMDGVVLGVFLFGGPVTVLLGGLDPTVTLVSKVIDFVLIRYIATWGLTEIYRKMIGRPANGRLGTPKLFIAGDSIINLTQRNFFSRLFSNSLATTGPSAQYRGDPTKGFVTEHAHDVSRGDIVLNVVLAHKISAGNMSIKQATFPKTGAFFGSRLFAGSSQNITIPIELPIDPNASDAEKNIMDATSGTFAIMLAYKVIGVNAVMRASIGGTLWNPAYTFSRAGVHTTPTPVAVNDEAKEIIEKGKLVANYAMIAKVTNKKAMAAGAPPKKAKNRIATPGGIDLNSRLLKMNVKEQGQTRASFNDKAWDMMFIDGVTPHVSEIVPVTPLMLQTMLGQSSLN
jgi:hypothetical protein